MAEWINEKPIQHRAGHGTEFLADRADLRGGVKVITHITNDPKLIKSDYAEFAAWHAHNIHPQLNGFSGYDCIEFMEKAND